MLNYWWVTRPNRKLNAVPEVLVAFADISLNQEWEGQRDSHLAYEEALESAGLKRQGIIQSMSKAGCPVPYLYSWNLTMLLQNGHINQYLNELFRTRDASCLKGKKMGIEIGKKFKNVLKELEVWGNEYIVR